MSRKTVNLALAALLLFTTSWAQAGTLSVVGQSRWVHVGKVFDGDTFRTTTGEKVRLLGINTPEVAHGKEPGQPFGKDAKKRLEQLITGKMVRLQLDRDRKDDYGRTLAQLYLRDGSWINIQLIHDGLALVYTFTPNFQWADKLLKAETEARNKKRGIWNTEPFRVLDARDVKARHIGQFRLVRGEVKAAGKWRFQLGELTVTIPRSARKWFNPSQLPQNGQSVVVRGRIRTASNGGLFLAMHSPYDME